jgi:D-alanyl-D-alanine carboxypeptidase
LFRAGSAYSYTDTGYILVGMIIERVTGHAYYDELRARLLGPLHLDDVVPTIAPRSQPIAAGYVAPTLLTVATGLVGKLTDEKGTITQILHTEWTGGGLFTTPTMLVRFYGELVEGHVVSPAAFRTMVAAAQGQERPYGYGIFVFDDPALGRWIGHGGWFPGYRTAVVHYIEHGITVALQANTDRRDVDLFNAAAHVAAAVIKPTD